MSGKREDVAKKKKDRLEKDQTVIKCYLSSLVVSQDDKRDIINAIKQRVIAYSKRQVIASIGLNLLIKERFNNVSLEDIKNVEFPDILNTTFIRQLLLGVKGAEQPFQEVNDLHERYPKLLEKINEHPRYTGDSNIYSAGAKKYSTNVWNHFWTNIKKRVYTFIDEYINDDSKHAVLFYLMNWKMSRDMQEKVQTLTPKVIELMKLQKEILGDEPVTDVWRKNKNNFPRLLRYNILVSKITSGKKFNIVPLSTIKNHYITIDNLVLHGILKDTKVVSCSFEDFKTIRDDLWKSVFDFDKLANKKLSFTFNIETDGLAASVHFQQPKRKLKLSPIHKEHNTSGVDVWACDPGRTNIFYMVKKIEDNSYTSLRLTRNQYYKESGIVRAKKKSERWQSHNDIKKADLSSYSPKGVDLKEFRLFLSNYLRHWEVLWKEYSSDKWSLQRMRLFGGKKRVFANFFNTIESKSPNKKIVVCYGSSKFNPTARNEVAVPTSRAYKECTFRFPTSPVDEFRTSKVSCEDNETILQRVVRVDTGKTVRGLLWYSSTIESKNKFVNRDRNAAINILNCFTLPIRPSMLCRSRNNTRIVQRVGRTILC
jgi:hypothetical protein